MAHSLSAKKRVRQNITRRAINRWRLKAMRTAIKDFLVSTSGDDVNAAREQFRKTASIIDRSAQKGVIHRNQAARRKSRLNAKLKAMAA